MVPPVVDEKAVTSVQNRARCPRSVDCFAKIREELASMPNCVQLNDRILVFLAPSTTHYGIRDWIHPVVWVPFSELRRRKPLDNGKMCGRLDICTKRRGF